MPSTEGSNMDSFWKLSDSKEKLRIDASHKILNNLHRQKRQNQDNFSENLAYDLKRIVSGLSSDRINARKGYFVSLVEMLQMFPEEANIPKVYELMEKHLSMKGSKSEEADFLAGTMLCLGAVLRSNQATPDEIGIACQKLVVISSKRQYLAVASIQLIVDHLPKISSEDFSEHVWPKLVSACAWKGSSAKIESLWLLLELNSAFPTIPSKSFLKEHFKRKKLISEELPGEIAEVLMNGSTNLRIISQGPVFKGIINALSKSESLLETFWLKEIVPRVEKTSTFKTSLAFGLLKLIAAVWTNEDTVGTLLPRGLADVSLQLLSKVEASTEDDLMITSALESLVHHSKGNVKSQNQLITTLLTVNVSFDKISGSNLVGKLLANSAFETVKLAADLYKEALASDGACFTVDQRIFAGQHLAKLAGHPVAKEEYEWKAEIVCFLLAITQFEVKKVQWPLKSTPQPLQREVKFSLKETFYRALDTKVKKLEPACDILTKVALTADELLKVNVPFQPMSAEASKAWKEMIKTVKKIKESDEIRKEDRVFLMLLIHIGLQLLSNDAETAVELLSDLHVCYDKAKSGGSNPKKRKRESKTEENQDAEPHWVEVVTDLMLSLLSQNRAVLRQVVNSVTAMLCPYITPKALMTIMEVINPPEEEADDDDMDEDDDEFEPITEEDLAKLKLEQAANAGDESDDEEEESDDEDSEDDDDLDKTNPIENEEPSEELLELEKKLKECMDEDVGDGQDDIDIDALDDEAIAKLDTALGAVFRQLSGKKSTAEKKKEKKDALAQVHFKIRALDMIDNYLTHQPPISNVLSLALPLIRALESSSKDKLLAPLEIRIKGTLRKLTSIKKPEIDENLTGDALVELLEALVEMGNTGSSVVPMLNQPIALFSQLAYLIIKCSVQLKSSPKLESRIQEVLIKTLDSWFSNSQCILPPTFFQLPLQGSWSGILSIVPKLTEGGFSTETRPFRRIQAVTLLSTLYHNPNIRDQIDKNLTSDLAKKLMTSLDTFVKGDINLKHKMLCELLHLIFGLHLSGAKCVPWDEMKAILELVRDKVPKNRNFHEVKRAFNKISAPLKIKVVQGNEKRNEKKRKLSECNEAEANGEAADLEAADLSLMKVNGDGGGTKASEISEANGGEKKDKKKKKKKHSKEGRQKKKEEKRVHLEEQYKNIDLPSFMGALVDTMNTDENLGHGLENPKKKKQKVVEAENGEAADLSLTSEAKVNGGTPRGTRGGKDKKKKKPKVSS